MEPLDFLNGSLSLIVVAISFYVGLHILSKYFTLKKKEFLLVGLVAIFTSEPWWPHVISFFLALASMAPLTEQSYFLIGNIFIPIAILCWLMALTKFMWDEKKKVILIFGLLYVIIYEIILLSFIYIIDYQLIGETIGAVDVQYKPLMIILLITALAIILPTGLLFARESLKSDNKEVRLKGKFLIIAFVCFCAGATVDVLILSDPFSLIIARTLLVAASIGFLGGFIPPDWLKKMFLQKES